MCNCQTSKEMWEKLNSVYEQTTESAKHLLQEQFYAYKKDPSHDIATHVSTLENLAQKLAVTGVKIDDSMLITKILMTLPLEYRHFSTAWDSTAKEQQTILNSTNRLMVEESRMGIQGLNLNEVSPSEASFAKQRKVTFRGDKNRKKKKGKCFNCGSSEHCETEINK